LKTSSKSAGFSSRPSSFNKYSAIKTEVDGIIFASRKEARRYSELKLLERGKAIKGLQTQVKFSLDINGYHICNYFADFMYWENDVVVVEDCKGVKTPAYKLKAKLMRALHDITIKET